MIVSQAGPDEVQPCFAALRDSHPNLGSHECLKDKKDLAKDQIASSGARDKT
jgi:hypothetical protein